MGNWDYTNINASTTYTLGWQGAIDSQGYGHFVYIDWTEDYRIYYAKNTGSGWTTELVEVADDYMTLGTYVRLKSVSLAIDSNGKAHIAYCAWEAVYTPTTQRRAWVRYVTNASGSWVSVEVVHADPYPTTNVWYGESSIALDSSDEPKIALSYYYATVNKPWVYFTRVAGVWTEQSVTGAAAYGRVYLVIDDSDNPQVIETVSSINLFSWNGSSWDKTLIAASYQYNTTDHAIAFAKDDNGKLHVVWWEYPEPYPSTTPYNLLHRDNISGSWSTPDTVDTMTRDTLLYSAQGYVMIAKDEQGQLHLAFSCLGADPSDGEESGIQFARYTKYASGVWNTPVTVKWEGHNGYSIYDHGISAVATKPYIGFSADDFSIYGALVVTPRIGHVYVHTVVEV